MADSGIQLPPGHPDAGGVRAWLDETPDRGGEPGFIYSEITGYFMTLCHQLARLGGHEWVPRGERAAAWIVEHALHPSGAVLSRKYDDAARGAADPYSFENGRIALFDCAMVGFGLLQIHTLTGDRRWLDAAVRIGGFLERAFGTAIADRHSTFDVKTMSPVPASDRWSAHFGPFQLKCALFLDALTDATTDPAPRAFANRILAHALAAQHPSGRFPTTPSGTTTHLHPHTYTVEGLLYLGARHGRPDLVQAAAHAIDWSVTTCLGRSPQLQQWSEDAPAVIEGLRSDVLAQSLRAYELVKLLSPQTTWAWESQVPGLFGQLASFTLPSGGTSYGRDEYGPRPHHANAWCHFFAIEAQLFRALRAARRGHESLIVT